MHKKKTIQRHKDTINILIHMGNQLIVERKQLYDVITVRDQETQQNFSHRLGRMLKKLPLLEFQLPAPFETNEYKTMSMITYVLLLTKPPDIQEIEFVSRIALYIVETSIRYCHHIDNWFGFVMNSISGHISEAGKDLLQRQELIPNDIDPSLFGVDK
eukprot:306079_1